MNIKILLIRAIYTVIFAVLTGCAQIPQYQDASGNAVAKLRLKMESPIVSNLFLRSVDVEKCQLADGFLWLTGGTDSLYDKKIGMLDETPPAEGILEYIIPANKPIAAITVMHNAKANFADVMFVFDPTQQENIRNKQPGICEPLVFTPNTGGEYEISYRAGPGTCTTHIYQLKKSGTTVAKKDITNKSNIRVRVNSDGTLSCTPP